MEEYISRQAAIDEIGKCETIHEYDLNDNYIGYYCADEVDMVLRSLPSAQPERRKGKWIDNDIDPEAWNYCSICGEQAIDLYDFCPNCGADMRSQAEEPSKNPYFGCDDYIIHPCRGCDDYIAPNGCKSNGGCGDMRGEQE